MRRLTTLALTAFAALLALAPAAQAKELVDFIGGGEQVDFIGAKFGTLGGEFGAPNGIAVNQTGAGPAEPGEVYVADRGVNNSPHNRIQRFARDDNGTPSNPFDDSYTFISAWGADVVQDGGTGDQGDSTDANYEICTIAAQCKAAVPTGGNGAPAGNGALNLPHGVAVDQDTGDVYVTDSFNARVSVYDGAGNFLRSFGFDVVESGPGVQPAPDEVQELSVNADAGKFSLEFEGETTGARGLGAITNGSNAILNVQTASGAFEVGQAITAVSGSQVYFPPGTTITQVGANFLVVSEDSTVTNSFSNAPLIASDIDADAAAQEVEDELNALPTIGGAGGSVSVSGGPAGTAPLQIEFGGSLAGDDLPQIVAIDFGLGLGGDPGAGSATIATPTQGGAFETCVAADGDVCQAGAPGEAPGQLGVDFQQPAEGLALSPPDANPATGTVYLADTGNRRVSSFDLDGENPATIGAGLFDDGEPRNLVTDSRGILYASNTISPGANNDVARIERYDAADFHGGGQAFLDPITGPSREVQEVAVEATAGQYRLSFDGETTGDLDFDATNDEVQTALRDLASIDGDVGVRGVPPSFSGGASPFTVTFSGDFFGQDVEQIQCVAGTTPLSGGAGCSVATVHDGQDGPLDFPNINDRISALGIDRDSDGAGPDADTLYVAEPGIDTRIFQFGPTDDPGALAPPTAFDDTHALTSGLSSPRDIAVDEADGRLYATGRRGGGQTVWGVYVLGEEPSGPTLSLSSVTDIGCDSATVNGLINPNGPPDASYHAEYSLNGTDWTPTPSTLLGSQTTDQPVSVVVSPPPFGLTPNTEYHLRLVATVPLAPPVISSPETFTTAPCPPEAQTTGAPLRSTTSAQVSGRVFANSSPTDSHFEYVTEAEFQANGFANATLTDTRDAGSGATTRLLAERLTGLQPDTTYRYRVVADNGAPGSPAIGEAMSLTTLASDQLADQNDRDRFPGPPGSDRAWEQASIPDASGNPVIGTEAYSDSAHRLIYRVNGGISISDTGSFDSFYLAERSEAGWQTSVVTPPRAQTYGPKWGDPLTNPDLSQIVSRNESNATGGPQALWRLFPGGAPAQLHDGAVQAIAASGDTSRVLARAVGGLDPAFPAAVEPNAYQLDGASDPELQSLMPGGTPPACGVVAGGGAIFAADPDASHLYFSSQGDGPCAVPEVDPGGPTHLYHRDIDAAQTTLVDQPLSGAECESRFLRATADHALLWTQARLTAEDAEPANCLIPNAGGETDGDLYRYEAADQTLECLTCDLSPLDTDVSASDILVASDGSRAYLRAEARLLPGAAPRDTYRLDLPGSDLTHIGPLNLGAARATDDGSVLAFTSSAAFLNPLGAGATDNGGSAQVYRYSDADGSLACISCPTDGAEPRGAAELPLAGGRNVSPLTPDGQMVVFSSPTKLTGADQNTAAAGSDASLGGDVYEWRDGLHLLVTDGITNWAGGPPFAQAVSRSGQDVFFLASAQYTPDALDNSSRLYTARIGGGFSFPEAEPPCPLEVCQGTPEGAPTDPDPASLDFRGAGNPGPATRSCAAPARAARRASRLARRYVTAARRATRLAARSSSARRTRALRRRAVRLRGAAKRRAAAAKRLRTRAKRCRANTNRRADR